MRLKKQFAATRGLVQVALRLLSETDPIPSLEEMSGEKRGSKYRYLVAKNSYESFYDLPERSESEGICPTCHQKDIYAFVKNLPRNVSQEYICKSCGVRGVSGRAIEKPVVVRFFGLGFAINDATADTMKMPEIQRRNIGKGIGKD